MINHVTGQLVEVYEDSVVVERDGVGYMVQTPRYALGELAAQRGREVTLHTLLFVEGNQNGGHLEPQLIGFPRSEDKVFFRRFISVKGIGSKKALKALTAPVGRVADWIEQGDVKALKTLPGIGARAAELIVAELKGKLHDLAVAAGAGDAVAAQLSASQRDALDIMVSLGDARPDAERWLDRAAELGEGADTPEQWVRAAYKVKTGVLAGSQ
ncbi:MAG: Holliday junction branch migration protein RuvA [Phycisphaerae bacterium]